MSKFDFYYGVVLGELILHHTDNLSCILQKSDISAAEHNIAGLLVKTLQSLRSDNCFGRKLRNKEATDLRVTELRLSWQRKLQEGLTVVLQAASYSFPATSEDYYQ